MCTLICIAYEDEYRAAEVFPSLLRLQAGNLIDIDDAVTVTRDRSGGLHLQRLTHVSGDTPSATFWQPLLHALLITPLTEGHESGAGTGASAPLAALGVATDFAANLRRQLQPGNSAILILIRRSMPAWSIPEVSRFGGAILMTSLRIQPGNATLPERPGT